MDLSKRSMIELHIAVVLFGISGLFGKLIPLDPVQIVFGRTIIGALALLVALGIKGQLNKIFVPGQWGVNIALGALLCVHWITFFKAIQVSSVAIGLLAFASFPVFVTFLEPILFKERWRKIDFITMFIVVFGLYLVVPGAGDESHIIEGLAWGIFSAFLYAMLSMINRFRVRRTESMALVFLQNMGATLTATLIMPFAGLPDIVEQLPLFLTLGLLCTTLPLAMMMNSLKVLKTQLVSLVICLEPLYGILLAALLLSEIPSASTLAGGVVIMGAIAVGSRTRSGANEH